VNAAGAKFYGDKHINTETRISVFPKFGIIYYTDNLLDNSIAEICRKRLEMSAQGKEIISVSLQPIEFGKNIHLSLGRGYLTMFKQILARIEASESDYLFFAEHDILYHPDHFKFIPYNATTYFYNEHTYKVDSKTGQAVFYYCKQTSGLCASRELLLQHYRLRVKRVEESGYDRNMGFEPGTHTPPRGIDVFPAKAWFAENPNIDIRHSTNLTPSRWSQDKFRNKNSCLGWKLTDSVPGWGITKDRFTNFLREDVL